MDLADTGRQRRRSDQPADPPTGHRISLAGAADSDGALSHTWQRRQAGVAAPVDEVLVDLIGDGDRAVLETQVGDRLQLRRGVDLAGRVVRGVDDDGPRLRVERVPQLVWVKAPIGCAQRDETWYGSADHAVRAIVLVERLEDDHLISGIHGGEHGGDHRLGRPARHGDLCLRIDPPAPGRRLLSRDRVTQLRRAPGERVLVVSIVQRARCRLEDPRIGREIGDPLRKVHRAVGPVDLQVQARHLADDRLGEALRLQRQPAEAWGGCFVSALDRRAPGEGWCWSTSSSAPAFPGCAPTNRRRRTSSGSWRRSRARPNG